MYFKLFTTSLVFALGAISAAAQSFEGQFRIVNMRTNTTARSYVPGSSIFVTNTLEFPGPFEIWEFTSADQGGYTIMNLGLRMYSVAGGAGSVLKTQNDPMTFSVTTAGNGEVHIGAVNDDLLWTVEGNFGRLDVTFDPATGDSGQRWRLIASNDEE